MWDGLVAGTLGWPNPTPSKEHVMSHPSLPSRWLRTTLLALAVAGVAAGCAGASGAAESSAGHADHASHAGHQQDMRAEDRIVAMKATAAYQDVAVAEDAGWGSSLDTLGCFESPEEGGMGVHYINDSLMDATVDATQPEALVYELDATGHVTGLVAHEYIVPVDAWTAKQPPQLFGMSFHRDPVLPLWVLHTWLWKDNPAGVFADWNPAVRLCPDGVKVFGTP
jgi:hypothetical protein